MNIGIIGGGPAGLSTAICLAEKGINVDLFERSEFPVDKVCGEGIMPTGVEFIQRHGMMDFLDKDYKKFYGVRYIPDNAKILEGIFNNGYGLGVRRTVLSRALYNKCLNSALINIHELSELQEIIKNDEIVVVEINSDKAVNNFEFDYLIGCDGLRSKVRKLAGLESNKYLECQRIGARIHYEKSPWSELVEVYWKQHIEAYVTPVSDNTIELAFLWDNKYIRPQENYRLDRGLKDLFPELFERVEGCKELSRLRSVGPISVTSKDIYKDRIILLGDAYIYLDGITGEGISIAFNEAEILAESIHNHDDDFIKYYKNEVKKITKRYLLMTHLVLLFSYYPSLRKFVFPLISKKFFSHLLEVNMGRKGLIR